MPLSCPMSGGGFRGPPPPLLLVPIVIQLVRSSRDPKMMAYLKELGKGGPVAIADNAHKIAQYILSKFPSSVLYWFTSKVLALPPDTAMQTTEFLKSRSDLDILLGEGAPVRQIEGAETELCGSSADVEKRLVKLELDYQQLQAQHTESLKMLTYKPADLEIPRDISLLEGTTVQAVEMPTDAESMQLVQLESIAQSPQQVTGDAEANAVLQDVGLRLGRIFLEWAGDTMKHTLVSAASRSSGNSAFVGAGVDLASRLVDAVVS